jgi:hypothetical protein
MQLQPSSTLLKRRRRRRKSLRLKDPRRLPLQLVPSLLPSQSLLASSQRIRSSASSIRPRHSMASPCTKNDKGEREQKHFFVEEMPPRSIAEYESKLAKEKITSAAASLRITAKVIASSATPVPATAKGPRPRLTNTQVQSILAKRDSNAYSGNVEPHYKTTFLEGGVHKTEWLEVCELPVKKLAYFEAELSKEEEEQEREIQVVTKL